MNKKCGFYIHVPSSAQSDRCIADNCICNHQMKMKMDDGCYICGCKGVVIVNGVTEGKKDDSNKLDWSLLPLEAVQEEVKVLMHGANKYGANNYKELDNFKTRYINALFRHMIAYAIGERIDPETGLSHMAHVACNAHFLIWGEMHGKNDKGADVVQAS